MITIGHIENYHIGLNQTWKGKKVSTLTGTEVLAMETELRKNANISKFVYEAGGEGEVYIAPCKPVEQKSNDVKKVYNIGGKSYNSLQELKEDAKNNGIVVTENCNGRSVVIRNGVVTINGIQQGTFDPDKQVILYVFGNTGDIDCQEGSVTVYGDVKEAIAHMGNISCTTIKGNAEAHMGNINATSIEGDAYASMGNIIYKK